MDETIQKKLAALAKIYREKLPEKIAHIEHLWETLQHQWDAALFQDFHREVHSLCGSAGTYGYSELSKAAREMEVFLKTMLDKESMPGIDQDIITNYLHQLKLAHTRNTPVQTSMFNTSLAEQLENRNIYIVLQDELLNQQIRNELQHIDYQVHLVDNLDILLLAVKERVPAAMIIDTDYLDQSGIKIISGIQKEYGSSIQLFCILPNSGLLPRLAAIRAGCHAFFQKPVDITQLIQKLDYRRSSNSDEAYRILIVDDSESLAKYYSLILNQAGMNARAITNPLNLLKELDAFQPHLLLMDVYMPDCTGYELAAILRQESLYTKIPIIFLSTEDDSNKKLFAISLGGDDFLTKPISPEHLISAVKSRSNRANILNYYMTTDSLTGLLNHSSILKKLDAQLNSSEDTFGCFVMIDIDNFKQINDTYGHRVGDQVIKKLSGLLLSRTRAQDSVGRYGGEEFALVLLWASTENSKKIVDELRLQFSQYCFNENGQEFHVSFSAGISFFEHQDDASKITEEADKSLYKAKSMGRNQVLVFDKTGKTI